VTGLQQRYTFLFFSFFFFSTLAVPAWSAAPILSSEALFNLSKERIFQIKVVNKQSGSKSSIGSGFIVESDAILATNYHVISDAIYEPNKYDLVSVDQYKREAKLKIVNIDIVNDLAVLKSDSHLGLPLTLSNKTPALGSPLYSMGNPHDLGTSIVQGTYNGLANNSFYERIHYSGSVNSGMSGGPTFNPQGEVVGINVASAGNQVSFLVPVDKLIKLIKDIKNTDVETIDFVSKAQRQLQESQKRLITAVLSHNWPTGQLGESRVIDDLPGLVNCWGRSIDREPEKSLITIFNKGCSLKDDIFISQNTSTGSLHYQFFWIDAEGISDRKFYHYLEQKKMSWRPDNRVKKEDISQFSCHESLITSDNEETTKAFYCARSYTQFQNLYDVLYFQIRKRNSKALVSHFTLAGVSQETAQSFHSGFIRNVSWP